MCFSIVNVKNKSQIKVPTASPILPACMLRLIEHKWLHHQMLHLTAHNVQMGGLCVNIDNINFLKFEF